MKFILLFFLIPVTYFALAQTNGHIIFEDKLDLHRNLPPEREEVKHMFPQYSTSKWELVFTKDESIYQPLKETELTGQSANQSGYYMRYGRDKRTLYKNLPDDRIVDSKDFMQKQFLIKGFTTSRKWKIGKKQKSILGYNCLEATFSEDSVTNVTAWFAPQIAVSNGPSDYQGLPGMILQIDINDGEKTITATDVKLDIVDTSAIIIPTKGKEITSHEFETLRKEKIKEFEQQRGTIYTRRH